LEGPLSLAVTTFALPFEEFLSDSFVVVGV